MEVQGEEAEIDIMIKMLKEDRYILIDGMDVRKMEIEEDEKSFVKKSSW